MNAKLFFEAMGEVGDAYYEEAANYRCPKRRWITAASLAACAAVVVTAAFAALWKPLSGQTVPRPEHDPPVLADPDDRWEDAEQSIRLNVNESSAPAAAANNIALMTEDYTAMSYEELLAYFAVSLPIPEALPDFTRRSGEFGIFRSENHGVYYDGNSVAFRNSDGTQGICVGLSKVFKHTYDIFALREDELKFTEINGRELAVFHYKNENGAECYYTEFLQEDVAFLIRGENLSAEDYAKCLQVLVNQTQQSGSAVHAVTGVVDAIDPYANRIGIRLDEEQALEYSRAYGVELPDGRSAEEYSIGDRVEVTYTGEPATILTIWAEQLVEITVLS